MSGLIRQTHRWLSITLTIAVVINIAALSLKVQSFLIGLLALIPLIFMILTGLYMFFLPYVAKRRGQRVAG
jgi:cellulose synthase/poly-beta-1,6-N-acetylglucosamine synthase-like glycosyltransferase